MQEFIDKTEERNGTPLNRKTLMAIQGFLAKTINFAENGEIIETNSDGDTLTTSLDDMGGIVETFVGEKTITKTTYIKTDTITEVLS